MTTDTININSTNYPMEDDGQGLARIMKDIFEAHQQIIIVSTAQTDVGLGELFKIPFRNVIELGWRPDDDIPFGGGMYITFNYYDLGEDGGIMEMSLEIYDFLIL
jgi:hypothetical protein